MTVIAAYVDGQGRTAIGCDTETDCGGARFDTGTKLVRLGAAIVGHCGPSLWGRWLTEDAPTIEDPNGLGLFADSWVGWAKARGHGGSDGEHHWVAGCMLVALPGSIWHVGSDGAVVRVMRYDAVGSGGQFAIGAIAALHSWTVVQPLHARAVVSQGVEAAIRHAPGCGGQVVVEVLDGAGERR